MQDLVKQLFDTLKSKNMTLVTAESCTGGMVSKAITDQSGASSVYECGFITYSNQSKIALIDVSPQTLEHYGAVSEQTAEEMARGALKKSNADIAISVTGVAGPTGGSAEKPVGTVYIGLANKDGVSTAKRCHFSGARDEIRLLTTQKALELVIAHV